MLILLVQGPHSVLYTMIQKQRKPLIGKSMDRNMCREADPQTGIDTKNDSSLTSMKILKSVERKC